MKRIAVTGGTGFLGGHMVRTMVARGDSVTVLTRDAASAERRLPSGVRALSWDARSRSVALGEQDAVVHLAGEQAVGRRWTKELKREIFESRVESTKALVGAIERMERRPKVLVSASGVGYYGARGSEPIDERGSAGTDFLAQVSVAWESAAEQAEALGVRVVRLRFGVIFGKDGGALGEMTKPFRMFVGGPLGTGKQVFSWIHVDDAVSAALLCIDDEAISGPVNVTSPYAVTNEELSHALGRALGRPSSLNVPAFALRLRFGEGADPILTGQRAVPTVLTQHGFGYRYPTVDEALADALA